MHDGILSQEEIDALLRGDSELPQASSLRRQPGKMITEMERDALGSWEYRYGYGCYHAVISAASQVSITTPQVMVATSEELQAEYPVPCLLIEVRYTRGLSGTNVLIIKKEDA